MLNWYPARLALHIVAMLLIAGFSIQCGYSQSTKTAPDLRFEWYTPNDGLAGQDNEVILQDRHGFLWFGSMDGLSRYDGHVFKTYSSPVVSPTEPVLSFVSDLLEDSKGTLWAASYELFKHDVLKDIFEPVHITISATDSPFINSISESTEEFLWLGLLEQGLILYNPESGHQTHFEHIPDDPTSISNNTVNHVLVNSEGNTWVCTEDGLNQFIEGSFTRHLSGRGEASHCERIIEDKENTDILWLTTRGGLIQFNTRTHASTPFYPVKEEAETQLLNRLTGGIIDPVDPTLLWLTGWSSGLHRFDITTKTFTSYSAEPGKPYGLPSNQLYTINSDRSGVLWIGTSEAGVIRFKPGNNRFKNYTLAPHGLGGPDAGFSRGIYASPNENDVIWVGTELGTLQRVYRNGHETEEQYGVRSHVEAVVHGAIRTITEDPLGTLWFSSYEGLCRLNRPSNKVDCFSHNPADPSSISDNDVFFLHVDRDGMLWATTDRGLNKMNPTRPGVFERHIYQPNHSEIDSGAANSNRIVPVDSVNENVIWKMFEDRKGLFWLATNGGLIQFNPHTAEFTGPSQLTGDTNSPLLGNIVGGVTERGVEPGIIWVAVQRRGLIGFDTESGAYKQYTKQNSALPDNISFGIYSDNYGYIWLSTANQGLVRFNPETEEFRQFTQDDGIAGYGFVGNSHFKSASGELFFGGYGGITAFYPEDIVLDNTPPQVVLTDVLLFNESITPGPDSPLKQALVDSEELIFEHNQNSISFDFAVLHFKSPKKNRYAYKLQGFDEDWIEDAGTDRLATYTNLPPGYYTFIVKAANGDGVWNEVGAYINIEILHPWWQQWWAYVLYGLVFMGGIFAVDQFQRARLIQRERARAELRERDLRAEAAETMANYLQSENLRQTQELEAARTLQLSMLPQNVPQHETVDLAFFMQTATEVGGDYYDFDLSDRGILTLAIGDATGHGTKAGTMVTATKSLWHAFARDPDLASILHKSGTALKQMGLSKLYMALALVRLEGHTLTLAGAGMPPALLYRAQSKAIERIPLKGIPLGGPVPFPYQTTQVNLSSGDALLLMSDGFPELFNPEGVMLGYEQSVDVFTEVANLSPKGVINHLKQVASNWLAGTTQNDDMTFVVMKVKDRI